MKPRSFVPLDQFGADHWSTLAYFETLAVDNNRRIDHRRMRCDASRHPLAAHLPLALGTGKYPTRLKGGVELHDHDDWDCIEDLEEAGLIIVHGSGLNPLVALTERGWEIASALRKHRAASRLSAGSYRTFEVPSSAQSSGAAPSTTALDPPAQP